MSLSRDNVVGYMLINPLRPYHARVNALIGNCAIVYESDEEFGTLPVITPEHVDLNLPSVKIGAYKCRSKGCFVKVAG